MPQELPACVVHGECPPADPDRPVRRLPHGEEVAQRVQLGRGRGLQMDDPRGVVRVQRLEARASDRRAVPVDRIHDPHSRRDRHRLSVDLDPQPRVDVLRPGCAGVVRLLTDRARRAASGRSSAEPRLRRQHDDLADAEPAQPRRPPLGRRAPDRPQNAGAVPADECALGAQLLPHLRARVPAVVVLKQDHPMRRPHQPVRDRPAEPRTAEGPRAPVLAPERVLGMIPTAPRPASEAQLREAERVLELLRADLLRPDPGCPKQRRPGCARLHDRAEDAAVRPRRGPQPDRQALHAAAEIREPPRALPRPELRGRPGAVRGELREAVPHRQSVRHHRAAVERKYRMSVCALAAATHHSSAPAAASATRHSAQARPSRRAPSHAAAAAMPASSKPTAALNSVIPHSAPTARMSRPACGFSSTRCSPPTPMSVVAQSNAFPSSATSSRRQTTGSPPGQSPAQYAVREMAAWSDLVPEIARALGIQPEQVPSPGTQEFTGMLGRLTERNPDLAGRVMDAVVGGDAPQIPTLAVMRREAKRAGLLSRLLGLVQKRDPTQSSRRRIHRTRLTLLVGGAVVVLLIMLQMRQPPAHRAPARPPAGGAAAHRPAAPQLPAAQQPPAPTPPARAPEGGTAAPPAAKAQPPALAPSLPPMPPGLAPPAPAGPGAPGPSAPPPSGGSESGTVLAAAPSQAGSKAEGAQVVAGDADADA